MTLAVAAVLCITVAASYLGLLITVSIGADILRVMTGCFQPSCY